MSLSNTYNLINALLSLVLAVLYAIVLFKVCSGSQFNFVIVVTATMLLSNLTAILTNYSNYYLTGLAVPDELNPNPYYPPKVWALIWIQGFSTIIRDGCYNAAHWEFAYKYFAISHTVPLLLKGEAPTECRTKFNKVLYISLMIFNILVAILSGGDYIYYNLHVLTG